MQLRINLTNKFLYKKHKNYLNIPIRGEIIAILRDMEKSQTKPTVAMMQTLFEEVEPKGKPLLVEKKNFKETEKVRFREK